MVRRSIAMALVIWLAWVACAGASEVPDPKNRVSLSVERERSVENDWVSATLSLTLEDKDPAKLADRVNQDVNWAVGIAKQEPSVELRTTGYRTFPIDSKLSSAVRHWRSSQTLAIEGPDAAKLSALLGQLQARLQLSGITFSISPDRRRGVEDELISGALDAFRARAELVRKKLGAKGYEIVQLHVNTSGGRPVPMHMRAMGSAEVAISAPSLEGGTSDVKVSVNGTVELLF